MTNDEGTGAIIVRCKKGDLGKQLSATFYHRYFNAFDNDPERFYSSVNEMGPNQYEAVFEDLPPARYTVQFEGYKPRSVSAAKTADVRPGKTVTLDWRAG